MVSRLDIAVLPPEAEAIEADCFVVVDALRATTTIATLFGRGLRRLTVVDSIEAAFTLKEETGAVLFGEVGGLPPEGCDYGNSPVEASSVPLAPEAVLFTTNGTRAICSLAPRGTVVTGAVTNAAAVADAVQRHERVAIVCAGEGGGKRFALEDLLAARVIAEQLLAREPDIRVGDGVRLALALQPTPLSASGHARHLARLGLDADIEFASRAGLSHAVPTVVESGLGWAILQDGAKS